MDKKQVEIRALTEAELVSLMLTAPISEKRNLIEIAYAYKERPYEFLDKRAVEKSGILINGRPIYCGYLTERKGRYFIWTIVNSNVADQYTLFKVAKRISRNWADKYGVVYATMEKINPKNMFWTERIGFKPIEESDSFITYELKGGHYGVL